MKKILLPLLAVVFLGAAGASAWYFLMRKEKPYRAETLLPPSSAGVLYVENADEARAHWKTSPPGRIFGEKEVQDFLQKPIAAAQDKAGNPGAFDVLSKILPFAHREAFLCFLGIDVTPDFSVSFLSGFDAGDQSSQAAKGVDDAMAALRNRYPKGVREEKKHEGVAYETWSPSKNFVLCRARVGNFFLFSSQEPALIACIDQAKAVRAGKSNGLKDNPTYQRALQSVDAKRDAIVFVNVEALVAKFKPLLGAAGAGNSSLTKQFDAIKSIAASVRFEPQQLVQKVFVESPEAMRPPTLQLERTWGRKSLPLVSAQSLAYLGMGLDLGKYYDTIIAELASSPSSAQVGKAVQQMNEVLASQNVNLRNDLIGKMGPEFAASLEWGQTEAYPRVLVMAETPDAAGLMTALDRVSTFILPMVAGASGESAGAKMGTLDVGGTTIHQTLMMPKDGLGVFYAASGGMMIFAFQENALPTVFDAMS
ncbi:MAG: DUF3352 domain-containing protein, partial [Verrucomicrobiae bacterium]|nr:DUF3352 domain-containing protein [Verrucomicrobiae bacterium]